jgi:mannosyl-3-phosphoglycerate phosphatase family protein
MKSNLISEMKSKFIIFSDLDGTLLDHHTYSFAAANESIDYIKINSIPLILVSSKTQPEMLKYQKDLNITGLPFVVENGAAVYTASGYFDNKPDYVTNDGLVCYQFGLPFEELKEKLEEISQKYNYQIKGFHNSNKREIIEKTGLNDEQAEMAMQREFSIPLFYDDKAEEILKQEISELGLNILYGGRFMHLLGNANKGDAMRILLKMYQQKYNGVDIKSIALGDSPNDFDMLAEADFPVLVKRHDGTYADITNLDSLIYGQEIGPIAWNTAVLSILKNS